MSWLYGYPITISNVVINENNEYIALYSTNEVGFSKLTKFIFPEKWTFPREEWNQKANDSFKKSIFPGGNVNIKFQMKMF